MKMPEIEVVLFATEDVITTSTGSGTVNTWKPGDPITLVPDEFED